MEKNAKITAIKHADVYGKILMYLKIETEKGTQMVNIGEKTFERVEELTTIQPEKAKIK